ncbi:MAG: lipid A biosynthesis protein [Rhodobacteraceae bacterium]|nr:lipid A biosynthesis protein [Paracoccaceae bacterium]MAY45436.1 lipid A biosynthesis protein [Paracoccaceae bacterium]QEW22406.1 lipid-A-disaccharide synthase [Marinibacterium anthonyi]
MDNVLAFFHVTSMAELIWVAIGIFGQLLFSMRFILQWLASEKARRSVVPEVFWWFSIGGGLILFAYALHRRDPVFILGQSLGIFIYARNLWLVYAEKRRT